MPLGGVSLSSVSESTINAVSVAVAISVARGSSYSVALSGGGAESVNVILTDTNAYVWDSGIVSAGNVDLEAKDTSEINATVAAVSASAGLSIGGSRAENRIGSEGAPAQVQAYLLDSDIDATGDLIQTATADAITGRRGSPSA